jgi:hypothetical protein
MRIFSRRLTLRFIGYVVRNCCRLLLRVLLTDLRDKILVQKLVNELLYLGLTVLRVLRPEMTLELICHFSIVGVFKKITSCSVVVLHLLLIIFEFLIISISSLLILLLGWVVREGHRTVSRSIISSKDYVT